MLVASQQINTLQHAGIQWYHEEYLSMDRDTKAVEPVRWVLASLSKLPKHALASSK